MKFRLLNVVAAAAVLTGLVSVSAVPAAADSVVSASDVSASITAPPSGGATFAVAGTIKNEGAFGQPSGSTLTFSANGGSVTGASAGCVVSSGSAVCTAGALQPGAAQSWTATVTTNPGVRSVISKTVASAATPELALPLDQANNTATAVTNVLYGVEATISSNPGVVRQGTDTLLTASAKNTEAPQNVTLTVDLGGKFDAAIQLAAGCSANLPAGTTVTCTHLYAAGQTRSFDIAVTTPSTGTSSTSTLTASGEGGGSASVTATTGLDAFASAFVPEGKSLSATNSKSTQTFNVLQGSAPGIPLKLNQVTLRAGTMCGSAPCDPTSVQALFPNDGTYSGSKKEFPYSWDISYGKLACNGIGAPKCIDVLYAILSGTSVAVKVEKCVTYGAALPQLRDVNEVCLQNATKSGSGVWTFRIALLRDIEIPIIGGTAGSR